MAKSTIPKKKMTTKQLANLKGVQNAKPKIEVEEPETEEEKTRRDWIANNEIIHSKYTELLLRRQKPPTFAMIAKETKLTVRTVERHLSNYDFEQIKHIFRMGNQAIYMNMFKHAATSPNPKWTELYLRWNGDIQQKVDITSGGKPLPAPAPMQGLVTLDPKTLPTEVLKALLEQQSESTNS
jgi:hypothetical protein